MYKDEIIDEVWKNRDSFACKHNHDLGQMVAELKARQGNRINVLADTVRQTTRLPQ
jgi:hypothetical protein